MTITLIQQDIRWGAVEENHAALEEYIKESPECDLYVLPEMFSTGFATEPEGIAEPLDGDGCCASLEWMRRMAKEQDAAVAGSVAVMNGNGRFYNRLYFVKPDGAAEYYDKRHLFVYGHEDEAYEAGGKRKVVEWRGVKFLLQICYDLRFPCFSRNAMTENGAAYDCCLYVANWPMSRRRVWDTLLASRALENQAFVVGVNRVGDDPVCHYNGGTMVIDAYGKILGMAGDEQQQSVTILLDMQRLAAFREKFPVLRDAD